MLEVTASNNMSTAHAGAESSAEYIQFEHPLHFKGELQHYVFVCLCAYAMQRKKKKTNKQWCVVRECSAFDDAEEGSVCYAVKGKSTDC